MLRPRAVMLLGVLVLLLPSADGPLRARADSEPPLLNFFCTDRDRFGVWHPPLSGIEAFDVGQLHAGWYNNWSVVENPAHPAGMRFVQLVRIAQGEAPPDVDAACFDENRPRACPTWDEVEAIAQSNPASLWLIGNEPDTQDYVDADRYAEIYHEFYTHLKAADPSCQVAIGGVVQPTPIRLEYLDAILEAYETRYGPTPDDLPMPVDVWNVHNYVLREKKRYEGCLDCWGCGVPPGGPDEGELYPIDEHDDLNIWTGHLIAMRQWMKRNGYRDRPLIVSEFGILWPESFGPPDYPFDYVRVRKFMLDTFNWMMTTTDDTDTIGYRADDNRLVQAWSWFSLAEDELEGIKIPNASHLFNPDTLAIMPLGVDYGSYTAPLTTPFPGSVDLRPVALLRGLASGSGGGFVEVTIAAKVANDGAAWAQDVLVRFERDGVPAGEATISSIAPGTTETVSVLWTGLTPGQTYEATATVYPDAGTIECNPFNNVYTASVVLGDHWIYLPTIRKK